MGIYDTFTKRLRIRQKAGQPDVYQYNELPPALRGQIVHIFRDAIGRGVGEIHGENLWVSLERTVCRERGTFVLNDEHEMPEARCFWSILNEKVPDVLDVIEVGCRVIQFAVSPVARRIGEARMSSGEALEEFNARFREHSVGYQYESGEIVRVDSAMIHAEVIKPALHLLSDRDFSGANSEFLKAHEHYRHGRYEEAMVDALKAFESVMKTICDRRKWAYKADKATASVLIDTVFDNELVPSFVKSEFTALVSVLKDGAPTARNRAAGHGTGATPRAVPRHLAAYVLHMTAANIVFLVEAHKARG